VSVERLESEKPAIRLKKTGRRRNWSAILLRDATGFMEFAAKQFGGILKTYERNYPLAGWEFWRRRRRLRMN